jgi:hypothetical protein
MSDQTKYRALITNMTTNDDAFAVITETGDGVYIPPGVTRAAKLVAGEFRMVTVIPNNPERQSNTKWMGIFVEPPETEMPEVHRAQDDASLMDKIASWFEEGQYLTTDEVAEAFGLHSRTARELLDKLFEQRRAARADVYYGANATPAGHLWAADPGDFL